MRGDPSSQCLISCTREPPRNSAPWFGAPNEGLPASQARLSVFWPPGLCCCPWGQAILGSSQNKTENNPEFLAVKQYHNYVLFNFRNRAAEADPLGSAGCFEANKASILCCVTFAHPEGWQAASTEPSGSWGCCLFSRKGGHVV